MNLLKRLNTKLKKELQHLKDKLNDLEGQREYNIDIIEEVLRLSRDVYSAFLQASPDLKRRYISIFWQKFLVQDKQIIEAIPTAGIQALFKKQEVIISTKLSST